MSNPNKSYFDRYTDPVIREIDRVNIYEFENGMDYELTQSGKAINVDSIKEAQSKVLKNLKKDPAFYTNMLAAESVKMVGEYGSGKKPGKRDTAKSAEAIKKDGKMPKANKQDAPYGLKDNNEMKKVKSLKESLDEAYTLDNETTWTDPAKYKDGSMMPEKYVPLKDRPVPSNDKLNAEWEKRKGGFKKSMGDQLKMGKTNEDVNVKDSRTIKLTPTTKNKILTLVHEMAKKMKEGVAYKVNGQVTSFTNDAEAQDFKSKNSNVRTINKL